MFQMFLWTAITTVLGELLRPKPKFDTPAPSALGDFKMPTAELGRPIPLIYGECLVNGPNVTWFGDLRVDAITEDVKTDMIGGSEEVTKGYKYFMGAQLVFCTGFTPQELYRGSGLVELRVGDKRLTAVNHNNIPTKGMGAGGMFNFVYAKQDSKFSSQLINAGDYSKQYQRIVVDDPNLFGGEEKEGGFGGVIDFYYGQADQEPSDYLQRVWGTSQIPAFRGMCYAVLRQCYVGTTNYAKPVSAVLRRYPFFWQNYNAHNINRDANPVAIIVDLLVNKFAGLGFDFDELDMQSLEQVALTLYAEKLGLSFVFDQQAPGGDLIDEVLRHIDAVVYADVSTGLIKIKLIRADYDVSSLPELNPDNVLELKAVRASWDDTKNVVKIRYTNRDNNYQIDVVEHKNQANIDVRGGERDEETYDFLGISNSAAANKIAARVLRSVSAPVARLELTVNRRAFKLQRGDVFKLTWPALGINSMICRINRINYGDLTSPEISIEAVEDVFSVTDTSLPAPPASAWVEPMLIGVPANEAESIVEVPYQLAGGERRQAVTMAVRAGGLVTGYDTEMLLNGGYVPTAQARINTPSGLLTDPLDRWRTTITLENGVDLSMLRSAKTTEDKSGSNVFMLDDELLTFKTIVIDGVSGNATLTGVVRGVLDTVPASHATGARAWFLTNGARLVQAQDFEDDQSIRVRLTPIAARDRGDVGADLVLNLQSRAFRPYPPAAVSVNGSPSFSSVVGPADVRWQHRDRHALLASSTVAGSTAGYGSTILPAGMSYTVSVYVGSELKRTIPAIAGGQFEYTTLMRREDSSDGSLPVTMKLLASQDGHDSMQTAETEPFLMTGLGMCFGLALGGVQS